MAYQPNSENSEVVRFETHDGVWERTGYCCRCGECCVGDPFDGKEGESVVEGFCPLYRLVDLAGIRVGKCSNREHEYYLTGCAHWPSHPGQIEDKPSCTYSFRKISDNVDHLQVENGSSNI